MSNPDINNFPDLPTRKKNRIKNTLYKFKEKIYLFTGSDTKEYCFKHGKILRNCKCSLCIHGKRACYCNICDGKFLCEHNKPKNLCIACGGATVCVHNRIKSSCKDCDSATSICIHEKRKQTCKICDGANGICIHSKIKYRCKDCGKANLCVHSKIKYNCIDCNGSKCVHGKIKYRCNICGGSFICQCGKRKDSCYIHSKSRKSFCKNCDFTHIHKKNKTYPYCASCFYQLNPDTKIPINFKIRQNYFHDLIKQDFQITSYDKTLSACSNRRPDFFFECFTHSVIVEIDEDQHKGYDEKCDETRTNEIFTDLGDRPLVIIRFNPDRTKERPSCFVKNDKGVFIPDKEELTYRYERLKEKLEYHLENIPDEKYLTSEYLFYDTDELEDSSMIASFSSLTI